jgi:hypothetical protein
MLPAGGSELLFQGLAGLIRRPSQTLQEPIALGQEVGASHGQWGTGGLGPGAQSLQRPSKQHQIAITGEPAAIWMTKQALQDHTLLFLPPAQLAQKQVKLGQIRTPILRVPR